MKRSIALISSAVLMFSLLAAVAGQTAPGRRGITPEDYFAFEFVSDPRISPDGRMVAFVVTTIDQRQNRRVSNIWLVSADGSVPPRQITTSPQSSTSPRWSRDGKYLAFLSARPSASDDARPAPTGVVPQASPAPPAASGSPEPTGSPTLPGTPGVPSGVATATAETPRAQIYVLAMDGGEARRVTNLKNGVNSFQWSPDGTRFVALSRTGPSDGRSGGTPRSDVRHYRHLSYKFNDTGWFDDRRSHLWVVDARSGRARQITSGDDWNDTDPQWSPDGARIAFVSDRTGHAFDESRNTDVWVIPAAGGPLTKISDHEEADESPRWSPDGGMIAFIGQVRERDHPRIWLAPSNGGAPSTLAARDLDLIPANLQWSGDGKALYFETGIRGELQLFRVDTGARTLRQITTGPRGVHAMDVNAMTGRIVYEANDFSNLDDIYISDADGSGERRLTHYNAPLWSRLELQNVERFTYKGADGWDVDGFLVKPLGWREGKKYPLILNIHGGPAGMYGVDWYHEFQVYAARGWAVLFTNPRGSTGYGQKLERGIEGEWGGKDYIDIMNGVDAATARYPWIDKNRMGVTGGSYGGYMTNWIVSHTNIFKAAVTLRSVSDFISDEGTRDGAYGHRPDFGGDLFQRFDLYWDRSPLKYASNVRTPILILHSDNDYRVPLEQGEQWFRALKHFGVDAEFVIFPRENHNLTRTGEPKHLVESLNWQIYWFDRFLNGNASARPPDGD